jgi:hypothetical protein
VRALFAIFRVVFRREPPDVMKTILYRPAFFGLPFSVFAQDVMRGDSPWTPGERELFAAYTSSLNHCVF